MSQPSYTAEKTLKIFYFSHNDTVTKKMWFGNEYLRVNHLS